MSELVTGEAVVLDIRLARPATRAIAIGIDFLLEFTALFALTIPIGYVAADAGASESLIAGLTLFTVVGVFVGYTTAIETLTRGKSVGKYALGLRVVRDDGGPIRFRHAFVRALAGVFADFMTTFGCGALFTAVLNSKGKRIGDILAGTIVIRERAPRVADALPPVPPSLVNWAASTDLSRVPDQLAMSARSFLSRFHELAPAAREALGARLASAMMEYVSPPPPADVPAWAYLTAVLSERRRRALAEQGHGMQGGPQYGHPPTPYAQPAPPPGWTGTPYAQPTPPAGQPAPPVDRTGAPYDQPTSSPGQAASPADRAAAPGAQPSGQPPGQPLGSPSGPPSVPAPSAPGNPPQWAPPSGSPAAAPRQPVDQPEDKPADPHNGFAPPG